MKIHLNFTSDQFYAATTNTGKIKATDHLTGTAALPTESTSVTVTVSCNTTFIIDLAK